MLEELLDKEYLTSGEVISYADILDGHTVVLHGEAIGECIERGDFCWINVYDNENYISIGVWARLEMADVIEYWGDHNTTGDTLEIEGIVYRADPEADGELDMRAISISVLDNSGAGERVVLVPIWKIITAAALGLVTILLFASSIFASVKKNRESRKSHVLETYIEE